MADREEDWERERTTLTRRLDRERRARLQAESIAEQALREVYQKQQALLHETAEKDRLEREYLTALKVEQLRVVHVTMRTVQDIVNNCLNQLQLLRLDADGYVPTESLTLFDDAIQEISKKLKALGDLQAFAEKQMAIGYFLDLDDAPTRD
jgi:hypothetical protein